MLSFYFVEQILTISGLMERTGMSRSTIHFYLRQGLLPRPQKTSANRALYTEEHAKLLARIRQLKGIGRSLAEIRVALAGEVSLAKTAGIDLAELESTRVHRRILRVATEEFLARGYKQTPVADIIRKAGVTSQTFYSHFASKGALLAESFGTFMRWNLAFVEPKVQESTDLGERLLWRMLADLQASQLGSEVLSLVRAEPEADTDRGRMVEQAWSAVVDVLVAELKSALVAGSPPPVSLELLAYSMIGAHRNAALRASWDHKFSREELMATHLWIWLAVLAALGREVDVDSRLARYADLISEVARREPETPPALES
jgi:DNA-binding transcriptional MerR regulator